MDLLQNNQFNIESGSDKKMRTLNQKIFFAFVLTMPFTSGFAITGTISMPLIFAVILFLTMCFHFLFIRNVSKDFLGFDVFIVALFLVAVIFSAQPLLYKPAFLTVTEPFPEDKLISTME